MTESNSPKFLATDDWFYICDHHGSYGSLDFCLQEVANYITSEIEFDSFLLDLDFYQERYNSLCKQEILKVRQRCLKARTSWWRRLEHYPLQFNVRRFCRKT